SPTLHRHPTFKSYEGMIMRPIRLCITALLLLLPIFLVAQDGVPLFTEDFPPEEFAARRSMIADSIGSDAIAVFQGAPNPEGFVRFRQSNQFYYLTGIEVPHAYLTIDGLTGQSTLYLPHENERRAQGEGKVLSAEDHEFIVDELGFDGVFGVGLLAEHLGRAARRGNVEALYTLFSPAEGLAESRDGSLRTIADIASDPWDVSPSREGQFLTLLKSRFPSFEIRNLSPTLDAMRLVKSERELAMIRKATRVSGLALMEAMRSTRPGIKEYHLDAVAKYVYFRDGAQGEAYYSLIASASNAYYPHYNAGKRTMQDGDLVLMDYAPDVGYYMSDVTRQWPVNGTFNEWQTELYSFYLDCYQAILTRIRPDVTPSAIGTEALAAMRDILASSSFSEPKYQKAAETFVESFESRMDYPGASLGHWVGMSTHDVGNYSGPLKPGMVFTIEPALRVPEDQIYIRLEDLIIITEDGAEIVSDFVPMDIEGVEKLMEEEGLLQRYPAEIELLSEKRE
ncbi:aminopeptidase P N-terminal domain-containing protein, partial [Bacteroidota bacterium]